MKRKVILIIIDGCRQDYLQIGGIDTIRQLMDEGACAQDCRTVFPSMTHPAHTSIVTGLYPSGHGILAHHYFDRRCGRLRDFLSYNKFSGNSIAELVKSAGGRVVSIDEFTALGRGSDLYVNVPSHDPQEVAYWAVDAISRKSPDLLIMTFFDSDNIGTRYGPQSAEVKTCMRNIDDHIGTILGKAKQCYKDDELLVVLTSDHGMASTGKCILPDVRKMAQASLGDSTILAEGLYAQVYFDEIQARHIAEFAGIPGVDVMLEDRELLALNCLNESIGDLVVSCKEGYNLIEQDGGGPQGLHGSLVDECMRVPLVLWGAGVVPGRMTFCEVVDIAPTIAHFMGIKYPHFDGRWLAECFTESLKITTDKVTGAVRELRLEYRTRIQIIREMMDVRKAEAEGRLSEKECSSIIGESKQSLLKAVSEYERIKKPLK